MSEIVVGEVTIETRTASDKDELAVWRDRFPANVDSVRASAQAKIDFEAEKEEKRRQHDVETEAEVEAEDEVGA